MNFWESSALSRTGSKPIPVTTRGMCTVMKEQFGITEPDLAQLWVSPCLSGKGMFCAFASTASFESMEELHPLTWPD